MVDENNSYNSLPINTNINDLIIGKNFSGIIDEARIWNRALSSEEILASYDCSGSYSRNFTNLSDYNYTYYAYAIDNDGNENWTENRTIAIDNTPPTISGISPASGSSTTDTTPTISATFSDPISGINRSSINLTIDGSQIQNPTNTSTSISYTTSTLSYSSHTVRLSVADYAGNIGYNNWSFTVTQYTGGGSPPSTPTNIVPVADAGGPYTGYVNSSVIFDGSNSNDSDGAIVGYRWDFESDGTYDTDYLSSTSIAHNYSSIGEYTVTLEVKDDGGATDTDTATVTITEIPQENDPPIISNVTYTPKKITSNDIVTIFANITDDDYIISALLCWDDGVNSSNETMENEGDIYSASIGPFKPEKTVKFTIKATDSLNNLSTYKGEFLVVEPPVEEEVGDVIEDQEKEVLIKGTSINYVIFKSRTNLTNVTITIENITSDEIKDFAYTGEGEIYKYFNLTIKANNTPVSEEEIESSIIKFKVAQTWIDDNNINKSSVTLLRYHNKSWEALDTTQIDENKTAIFYTAITGGYSTFAVVGSKVVEKGTTLDKPEDEPIPWIIIFGFIISAIIALIFILFKAKLIYVEIEEVEVPKK